VRSAPSNVALGVLLLLLAGVFYPALMLDRRLAPEASLRGVAPWRQAWGPNPEPRPRELAAATQLGPRLAVIAREGLGAALWNPWIGGGRAGWLSSPREGGAPLPVAAALLARSGWAWSALLALALAASFAATWTAARWLGASPWGAAVAALAYSLAGPVATHWLDWQGSAVALGPVALLPALSPSPSWRRHAAAWAAAAALLVACGPPALAFLAVGAVVELARGGVHRRRMRAAALAAAVVLAVLATLPAAWLARAGGERGAAPGEAAPTPPIALRDLAVRPRPDAAPAPLRGGAAPATPADASFLGAATLLLAVAGLAGRGGRHRRLWAAVAAGALAVAAAPSPWLAAAGLSHRPAAAAALAAALLAGLGADALCRRLPAPAGRALGAALCAVVACELAPVALHGLPFASERELPQAAALPQALAADGARIVTLASTLPPDVAAAYGLADIRAAWFEREPTYVAALRSATAGAVQALDPAVAALGARWVLEPAALRLVSGIVYAEVSVAEARRTSGDGSSTARYVLPLPAATGRIGLPPASAAPGAVFLQDGSATVALEEDAALAEESADWRWFAVPPAAPRGNVVLGVMADGQAPATLPVALDASGLRLASHGAGVRVWEWSRARPFAGLTGAAGRAALRELAPGRVTVEVEAERPGTLVVQVKHRPALWRAAVDGGAVRTEKAGAVWTAVPVPAGRSVVVLAAVLPATVWLAAAAAAMIVALLALPRRAR
jgi:hypothetical protein